jgi:hypothetical protein
MTEKCSCQLEKVGTGYVGKLCRMHVQLIEEAVEASAQKREAESSCEARELVRWGNEFARECYKLMGYIVPEDYRFDKATHPQEQLCWQIAVAACEHFHGTDLQECADELDSGD